MGVRLRMLVKDDVVKNDVLKYNVVKDNLVNNVVDHKSADLKAKQPTFRWPRHSNTIEQLKGKQSELSCEIQDNLKELDLYQEEPTTRNMEEKEQKKKKKKKRNRKSKSGKMKNEKKEEYEESFTSLIAAESRTSVERAM